MGMGGGLRHSHSRHAQPRGFDVGARTVGMAARTGLGVPCNAQKTDLAQSVEWFQTKLVRDRHYFTYSLGDVGIYLFSQSQF